MNPTQMLRTIGNDSEKCCQAESPSILDNLLRQEKSLADRLSRVKAAREALEANPEISRVLELIAKANN